MTTAPAQTLGLMATWQLDQQLEQMLTRLGVHSQRQLCAAIDTLHAQCSDPVAMLQDLINLAHAQRETNPSGYVIHRIERMQFAIMPRERARIDGSRRAHREECARVCERRLQEADVDRIESVFDSLTDDQVSELIELAIERYPYLEMIVGDKRDRESMGEISKSMIVVMHETGGRS